MIKTMSYALFVGLLLFLPAEVFSASRGDLSEIFPSQGFEEQIEFWKEMFTAYGEREIIFHDRTDVRLIYEALRLERGIEKDPEEAGRQTRFLQQRKKELENQLSELETLFESGPGPALDDPGLTRHQKKILGAVSGRGYSPSAALFRRLKTTVRYQRGIRDKFRESLIRSGLYLEAMQEIFVGQGLPPELAFLPHIESSFEPSARSSAGATGMWQLMYGTVRGMLTINRLVDERADPLKSTEVAARLLKENYQALGNWPLAITAYNHGKNGMLRASKLHGSELRNIIDNYQSRYFGFASKNFYPEFLAALEVARNYEQYFGAVKPAAALKFDVLRLRKNVHISQFRRLSGLDQATLEGYNPHLTRYVWNRSRTLPAGIEIRVPPGTAPRIAESFQAASGSSPVVPAPPGGTRYRVRPGDTLTRIARRFATTVENIRQANAIPDADQIRVGEILHIP